jgi:8-oxo-dGTP pyrophosphatase MutT (NUDIX family)
MPSFLTINSHCFSQTEIEALPERHAARCVLFDRAGNVVMVSIDSEKKEKGRYLGIPGGKIEDGETNEQACIREVREESGFIVDVVFPLGSIALVRREHLSISHGFYAFVDIVEQQELQLTPEEQTENFATEVFSFDEVVTKLYDQYLHHHQTATLRNLTFILEAKRLLLAEVKK